MGNHKYSVGVDFGTESGRAVLVDVSDGSEVATSVYAYQNSVIDERLPITGPATQLAPDWACCPSHFTPAPPAASIPKPAARCSKG